MFLHKSRVYCRSALRNKKALLLHNHGSIVCGVSIQQAFYLIDALDKACKIQGIAGRRSWRINLP
ncbi:MAG TPA: hypothetical protein DCW35_04135 [Polynucleobacter sp.]|nr:hypothetical protein [Polynucleobacter sp.]